MRISLPYYRVSAFFDRQEAAGLWVVSDLQLYLDLYDYPLRGREQAERLFERRVAPQLAAAERGQMALDPALLIGLKALTPCLDDMVIAGGWVPYLFAAHERPSGEAVALKTRNLDVAVSREVPEREKPIDQLLTLDARLGSRRGTPIGVG